MPLFDPQTLGSIKAKISISSVIGRYVTWDAKKTRQIRGDWWANCPFHGEAHPSFHCEDNKGRYHCFGCGASGDHFSFLVEHAGLTFPQAVAELARDAGITLPNQDRLTPEQERERAARLEAQRIEHERQKVEAAALEAAEREETRENAYRIWKSCQPVIGTEGEAYLRGRGLSLPLEPYSKSIRYAPRLRHPNGNYYSALVCAVTGMDGCFKAIWRTHLDGHGKKAGLNGSTKMGWGPASGGAIWLGEPAARINTVEGLETGLSVLSMIGGREPVAVCMSTTGLVLFEPPLCVRTILCWPDGDIDKIRMVKGAEKFVESPGVKAGREHIAKMKELGLKAGMQPTVKNTRDYCDIWNGARRMMSPEHVGA